MQSTRILFEITRILVNLTRYLVNLTRILDHSSEFQLIQPNIFFRVPQYCWNIATLRTHEQIYRTRKCVHIHVHFLASGAKRATSQLLLSIATPLLPLIFLRCNVSSSSFLLFLSLSQSLSSSSTIS